MSLLYWKLFFHNAFFLFPTRPIIRLFSLYQKHRSRIIGKTEIIGDPAFIDDCMEFSQRLLECDPSTYEDLFVKNKFVFIQYSDAPYKNVMFGEYGVPAHYQKLKADGVGALMIYGFFCTTLSGRTLRSYLQLLRQPGYSKVPKEMTYTWLKKHQFPDTISRWFQIDRG